MSKRLSIWCQLGFHWIASLVVMLLIIGLLLIVIVMIRWLLLLLPQQVKHRGGRKCAIEWCLLLWIHSWQILWRMTKLLGDSSNSLRAGKLCLKRDRRRRSYFTLIWHRVIYCWLLLHQELFCSWVALETATCRQSWCSIELFILSSLITHVWSVRLEFIVADSSHHYFIHSRSLICADRISKSLSLMNN